MVNEFKLAFFHLRARAGCRSVHARGFAAGQQNYVDLRAELIQSDFCYLPFGNYYYYTHPPLLSQRTATAPGILSPTLLA